MEVVEKDFIAERLVNIEKCIKEIEQRNQTTYSRLKGRVSVEKLIEEFGLTNDTSLVMESLEEIDSLINSGKTYEDAYTTIIYCDCPPSNLAFLIHIEERFNTKATSPEQLQKLANIPPEYEGIERTYYMALEERYSLTLKKILKNGGKYRDLLAINPQDFGLPVTWDGLSENMNKEKTIQQVINICYEFNDPVYRHSVREVAEHLSAPYPEILKASRYYSF